MSGNSKLAVWTRLSSGVLWVLSPRSLDTTSLVQASCDTVRLILSGVCRLGELNSQRLKATLLCSALSRLAARLLHPTLERLVRRHWSLRKCWVLASLERLSVFHLCFLAKALAGFSSTTDSQGFLVVEWVVA